MNTKTFATMALAGLLAAGSIGGTAALASENDQQHESTVLADAKVTLTQAIATAEQQTGGKAYDAGIDGKAGAARIAVETNGPGGVQTVIVDAQNGQVVSTRAGNDED